MGSAAANAAEREVRRVAALEAKAALLDAYRVADDAGLSTLAYLVELALDEAIVETER